MIRTYEEWFNALANRSQLIASFPVPTGSLEGLAFNLANCNAHNELIIRAIQNLKKTPTITTVTPVITDDSLTTLFKDLFSNKNCSGAFCQLAAYDWLQTHDLNIIAAETRVADLLCKNPVTLDGRCELNYTTAYFDVKEFGFNEKLAKELQRKLQLHFDNKKEQVLIDGNYALSISEFQELLTQHKNIVLPPYNWSTE